MTRFSSLTLVVVAVAVVAAVAQPQRGNSNAAALGNTDISPLLNDPRMVRLHLNCIKGTGNCNALGRSLKQAIPEVLQKNCQRCTPQQKTNARKLIDFISRNYPKDYQQIMATYAKRG